MTKTLLPRHIAIVMDGNGRWAKKRFLPHIAGHRRGVEAARQIVKYCAQQKIEVLSLFAFSSENWLRPQKEVSYLMELFFAALQNELPTLKEYQIQLRFIGNRTQFSDQLVEKINEVEKETAHHGGLVLLIAVDYGGQWDICEASKLIAEDVINNRLSINDITTSEISKRLSFGDLPDPDLFIRTSGELRISNFMLWQLAYAELYFTDILWPDFTKENLAEAILSYTNRERRFGKREEKNAINVN